MARESTGRGLALLVAVVVMGVVTSCGITAQNEADRIPPADVPFGLLDEQRSPATSIVGTAADVYLIGNDRLVGVRRLLPSGSGLSDVVAALAAGPTEQERALGLSSALPAGQLGSVSSSRGVALVDLKPTFAELSSGDQSFAIGQIVFTLTGQPGIGRVAITLGGEAIEVPRGDGALTTDALSRDDFTQFGPA